MKVTVRVLFALLAALPALCIGGWSHAQLYKWVDENGVMNYSNQPPASPGNAKKLAVVEDKVSVYTPDPALLAAIDAERKGRGVSARMAERDRRSDTERHARQSAAVAALPAGGPCSIWPSDCLGPQDTYYYAPAYVAAGPRFRHRPPGYFRPGPAPAPRPAGFPPSRSLGRYSMQPVPKP